MKQWQTSHSSYSQKMLLDKAVYEDLKQWISTARRGDLAVVKSHSTGCGITTLLHAVIDECQCDAMIAAPSSTTHKRLKDYFSDVSKSSITALTKRKKVIVLDPVDALLSDPTTAMDTLEYVKKVEKLPTVCAGFSRRASLAKVLDSAGKNVRIFEFPKIQDEVAIPHLHQLFENVPRSVIRDTWNASEGDLRACIASLEMNLGGSTLKDTTCDGVDAIRRILYDKTLTIADAVRLYEGDSQLIEMGVFENYPPAAITPEECLNVSEAFECADFLDESIHGKQHWDLEPYHAYYIAANTAVALSKAHKKGHKIPSLDKVGTMWSRMNNQRGKMKSLGTIAQNLAETGRRMLPVQDIAYIRSIIMKLAEQNDFHGIEERVRGLEDKTVLSIMRLAKSNYTQTLHTKFKRYRARYSQ